MNSRPLLALALCGCASAPQTAPSPAAQNATADDAKSFVARLNEDLKRLTAESSTAEWIKNTYITDDTERNAASANERLLAYASEAVKTARQFKDLQLDFDTTRMLHLLRIQSPVIDDPQKRLEMTTLAARLEGYYGAAKDKKGRDLEQLERIIDRSRSYDELLDAWLSWHATAREQRARYARFVELQNEGARGAGFANMGDMWRAGYDMPPQDFEKETDRLWGQVKPLYDDLHCYVRAQLQKQYGKDKVPDGKPIPAHLLGNTWSQTWDNIYRLVEPYQGIANVEVDSALAAQTWDAVKVVKTGEAFFTSLGLDPLPKTFWERSMLVKPRDR
jgi:peptidyl-dipeptidase A